MHQVQREAREGGDRARDVGDDDDLGLGRSRGLEAQVERHAAGRQAAAHRVAQVHRAAVAPAAPAREAHGELAAQGAQRALELGHLVAVGVHDVEVLGQGAAHRARQRLGAAVLDQALADHALDLALEGLDPRVGLVAREARVELVAGGVRAHGQAHLEGLEVEAAQGPVEVVGAADGPARLHPGEARHRLARRAAQRRGRRRRAASGR